MSTPDLSHLKPSEKHGETMRSGLEAALTLHKQWHGSGVHPIKEKLEELVKHLEDASKEGNKEAGKLANYVHALNDHLDHIRDHHPDDAKFNEHVKELVASVKKSLKDHPADDEKLTESLKNVFKMYKVKVPGELVRAADTPWHLEYKGQVTDHLGSKGLFGKGMSFALSTVSVGVIGHGMLNVKRGLLGYTDPESGEQKSGSLSTLVVGGLEMAAGLASVKKALTGRWGFGRAVNEREHHHHHDHDHGHGHSH